MSLHLYFYLGTKDLDVRTVRSISHGEASVESIRKSTDTRSRGC